MDKLSKSLVLCVSQEDEHTPDALLVKCDFCEKFVWVSLHNVDKSPTCMVCLQRLVKEGEESGNPVEPVLAPQDVLEAFKYLMEKRRKDGKV